MMPAVAACESLSSRACSLGRCVWRCRTSEKAARLADEETRLDDREFRYRGPQASSVFRKYTQVAITSIRECSNDPLRPCVDSDSAVSVIRSRAGCRRNFHARSSAASALPSCPRSSSHPKDCARVPKYRLTPEFAFDSAPVSSRSPPKMATRPAGPDRSLTAASLLSATSSTMDSKPSTPYLDSHTPGHDLELAKPYPGLEGDDRTAATDGVDSLHKQARKHARPQPSTWYGKGWAWLIQSDQIEDHGVGPLPAEERTDAHFFSVSAVPPASCHADWTDAHCCRTSTSGSV